MKAHWNPLTLLTFSLWLLLSYLSIALAATVNPAPSAVVAASAMPVVEQATITSSVTTTVTITDTTASTSTVPSTPPTTPSGTGEHVEFPLLPLAEGEALSATQIFNLVSPSIVYVETPIATGSGVLIDHGYLVSNAHVVWPYNSVRIVFPDGTEFEDVEVVGWDLMADLSLLKLPEEPGLAAIPQPLVDGSELPIGSDVYLIGYPGEVDSFPQPTISHGMLGRVRTWPTTGMDVFQVDADTAGGQSGGVMVTERGEVIGISTFTFTEANFAMVPSTAYAVSRLNALANESVTGFSDRRPLKLEAAKEHSGRLNDSFDSDLYVLEVEPGEIVEITVEGVGKPEIYVTMANYWWDYFGSEEVDENTHSVQFFTEKEAGPYLITIAQQSAFRNDYTLTSSHRLAFYPDVDDNIELAVSDTEPVTMAGAIDVPGDLDRFFVKLKAGEKVAVEVDSLTTAPLLTMVYDGPSLFEFIQSFEGGAPNVFGENARIVYEALNDGRYAFIVESATVEDVGGYSITISVADKDEEITEILESYFLRSSPYGGLSSYRSRYNSFEIYFPGDWYSVEECPVGVTACFEADPETGILITEEDLDNLPVELKENSLDSYVDLIVELMLSTSQGAKVLVREPLTTPQGLQGTKLVVSARAGTVVTSRFIYVNEETGKAFNAMYYTTGRGYVEMEELIDYSFETFRLWDEEHYEDDPIFHLDDGLFWLTDGRYEEAIDSFTFALELDPDLADAYAMRASAYGLMGEYDLAIADLEQAMELDPEESDYVEELALVHWVKGDLDMALELVTQAINDNPNDEDGYNNRALMRVQAGDFEGALEDMDEVEALAGGEIPPDLLDSRAYIYLKMEDYEAAKEDYDEVLAKDFKSPYSLLGAGITYARLGMMDEAMPLLEYGMELFYESPAELPYPQLAELLEMSAEYLPAQ